MRISDWSSDVCSSDLMLAIGEMFGLDREEGGQAAGDRMVPVAHGHVEIVASRMIGIRAGFGGNDDRIAGGVEGHAGAKAVWPPQQSHHLFIGQPAGEGVIRSEEHTSALQSLMRISYAA